MHSCCDSPRLNFSASYCVNASLTVSHGINDFVLTFPLYNDLSTCRYSSYLDLKCGHVQVNANICLILKKFQSNWGIFLVYYMQLSRLSNSRFRISSYSSSMTILKNILKSKAVLILSDYMFTTQLSLPTSSFLVYPLASQMVSQC